VNKKAAREAARNAKQVIEPLKWELTATLELAGYPTHEELAKAEQFEQTFVDAMKGS
jgi:hypothetical protein